MKRYIRIKYLRIHVGTICNNISIKQYVSIIDQIDGENINLFIELF